MLPGKRTIALGLAMLVAVGISIRLRRPPVAPHNAPSSPPATAPVVPSPSTVTPPPVPTPNPTAAVTSQPTKPVDLNEQLRNLTIRGFHGSRLRMAAFRAHLQFTDAEHEKMLDEIIDFRHAIAVVDAPLARVVSFDGNTLVVQIPAHPTEGAAVREAFVQQIRKDFPAERAEQIVAGLEPLSGLFDYFGQFTMTYTVERPRPDNQVGVVTRATATDPADAVAVKKASSLSGDGWMSRELLEMDCETLLKTIDAYFPKTSGGG